MFLRGDIWRAVAINRLQVPTLLSLRDRYWERAGQLLANFFSLSLATVPEVFAKVNSAQFPCRMADCSNTVGEDAMRYTTLPTHLLKALYTFYSRHHQGPTLGWVFSAKTSRYQWCLQQTGKLI